MREGACEGVWGGEPLTAATGQRPPRNGRHHSARPPSWSCRPSGSRCSRWRASARSVCGRWAARRAGSGTPSTPPSRTPPSQNRLLPAALTALTGLGEVWGGVGVGLGLPTRRTGHPRAGWGRGGVPPVEEGAAPPWGGYRGCSASGSPSLYKVPYSVAFPSIWELPPVGK